MTLGDTIDLMERFEMRLNVADRHAAPVEREHVRVELRQAAHAGRHELRAEASVAVARDLRR